MNTNVAVLITMANQIGDFFVTLKNHSQSLEEIAHHLRRFWAPRMRLALIAHVDQKAGAGLSDIVLESLHTHRSVVADTPTAAAPSCPAT